MLICGGGAVRTAFLWRRGTIAAYERCGRRFCGGEALLRRMSGADGVFVAERHYCGGETRRHSSSCSSPLPLTASARPEPAQPTAAYLAPPAFDRA